MSLILDRIVSNVIEALDASKKSTSPYDTEAEIIRVEGDTAYVHIKGGYPETPVKLTIDAKKGDKVQIRVTNEGAWLMGNMTAPPTDDAVAKIANVKAEKADVKAGEAYDLAEQAEKIGIENTEEMAIQVIRINGDIAELQDQIDGNITTWFYAYAPTLSNPPVTLDPNNPDSTNWDTTTKKDNHLGDLFYDTTTGYAYRFMKENNTYSWGQITDQDVTEALRLAGEAQDTADSKRRVFVTTPTPPYDVGDLWAEGSNGDIKKCKTAKADGQSYSASDWELASKYTDDSAFTAFRDGTYATFVTNTGNALNGKVTTYYQASAPTTTVTGDLWIDTDDDNKLYRWSGTSWVSVQDGKIQTALTNAASAQATADGKIVTFAQASQPTATDVGDLWIDTDDNNKMYRWSGTSWVALTDTSALNTFINGTFATTVSNLQTGIADAKVETWKQDNDPSSSWNAGDKPKHEGDMWYCTKSSDTTHYGKYWIYTGSAWEEMVATPPDAVFDEIDGKATIFTGNTTPSNPSEGDLWFKSANDPILTYVSGTWTEYNKYTDDTVANSAVATTVSLYYRSTTQSTPPIDTSTTIGTATDTNNAWEYVMPVPKRDCYFYTCEKYTSVGGTVTFSTVRELSNATYESKWVSSNDATYIDGGRLYANSVTADQINTNTLTVGSLSDGSSYSTTTQMNTAISDAVDNIELGGRNYLENSRTMGGYFTNYNHSSGDRSHVVWDDGYCYTELIGSTGDWNGMVGMPTHRMDPVLLDGSDWTVSFDYKCSSNTTAFFAVSGSSFPIGHLVCQSSSRTKYTSWSLTLENTSGEWQRAEIHFNKKVSDLTSGSGNVTSWFIQLYNRTANTLQVRKVKLERGNIATDWTPAPEDITTGGGNNLLRGTATMGNSSGGLWSDGLFYASGTGTRTFKYAISDSPISNISTGFLSTATNASITVSNGFAQGRVPVAKKQVVISAWVKGTAGDYVALQPIWTNASAERLEGGQMNWQLPDSNWHRLEWWRMPMYDHSDGYASATTYTLNAGYVYHKALTVGNTLTVCGLKLEYGGKATDWSPSTLEVDSAIDDAAKTASRYITAIDSNGVKVHAENNVNSNFSLINADGMKIYKGGNTDEYNLASFGEEITLGTEANGYVNINSGGFGIYSNEAQLAAFNKTGIILNAENGDPAITIATTGETITKTITIQVNSWYKVESERLESGEGHSESFLLGLFNASQVKVKTSAPKLSNSSIGTLTTYTINKPSSSSSTSSVTIANSEPLALYTDVDAYLHFQRNGRLRLQLTAINMEQGAGTHENVYIYVSNITYTETVDVPSIKCDGTITALDHDTPIGTVMRDSFSKSIASGTTLTAMGLNKSMSAGSWVVNYSMRFPSNNTGRRGAAVGINGSNMASGYTLSPPVSGEVTALTGSTVTKQDSDWTLDFFARQNSGSTQTVTVYYDIIRIA